MNILLVCQSLPLLCLALARGESAELEDAQPRLDSVRRNTIFHQNFVTHAKNDQNILLDIYEKVQENESKSSDLQKEQKDHGILLDLMQRAKNSQTKVTKVNETPLKGQREHLPRDILPRKKRRRVTIIRKGKSPDAELAKSSKRRRRPSHVKLYWDKRLEMAPKNVMSEAIFRDEYKKTTPPPTRKGEGVEYKPTTEKPERTHTHTQHHTEIDLNLIEEALEDISMEVPEFVTTVEESLKDIPSEVPKIEESIKDTTVNEPDFVTTIEDSLEDIPIEVSAMVINSLKQKEEPVKSKNSKSFIEPSYHKPAYYDSPVFPNFPQLKKPFKPIYPVSHYKLNEKQTKGINKHTPKKKLKPVKQFQSPKLKFETEHSDKKLSYSPIVSANMISTTPLPTKYHSPPDQTQYHSSTTAPMTNVSPTSPVPPSQGYQSSTLPTIKPFLTSNYQPVYQPINRTNHHVVINRTQPPLLQNRTTPTKAPQDLSKLLFYPQSTPKNLSPSRENIFNSDFGETEIVLKESFNQDRNNIEKRKSQQFYQNPSKRPFETLSYSEPNNFVTTALPKHGPTNMYGYATRHSFVNVQFGGNTAVNKAYPFAKNLGINTDKNYRTLNPPINYEHTQPDNPLPSPTYSNHWKQYSKYHMAANKDNLANLLFSRNKNIGQSGNPLSPFLSPQLQVISNTTPLPPILPPLTPTKHKVNIKTNRKTTPKTYPRVPSIRFDQEVLSTNFNPVTLPPYVHKVAPQINVFQRETNRMLKFPEYSDPTISYQLYKKDHRKRGIDYTNTRDNSKQPQNTNPDILITTNPNPRSLPASSSDSENASQALRFPFQLYNGDQLGPEHRESRLYSPHTGGVGTEGQNYRTGPAIQFVDDLDATKKEMKHQEDSAPVDQIQRSNRKIRFPE